MSPVLIYSRTSCAPCNQLKRWLHDKRISFSVVDLDENPDLATNVFSITGAMQIPVTKIGETYVSGLDYSRLSSLLAV